MTLINACDLDTSPAACLVEDMLPLTGTGFLYGPSRHGKSLVTNGELALAVANGTEFFGRQTVQGSVAICVGEGLYDAGVRKQARLAREQRDRLARAGQLAAERGQEAARAWLDAQPPYTDERLFIKTESFVLPVRSEGEPSRSLTQAITQLSQIPDLALVILDSFSDFTGGLSISNDTSANRAVLGMKELAGALDCFVLAVAHPTQKGDRMLGAGRLFNSSDVVIAVQPEEGSTGLGGVPTGALVISEKFKYGGTFEPFSYTIEPCAWHEPARDEDTGELIPGEPPRLVTSATVRLRTDDAAGGLRLPGAGRPRTAPPLPELAITAPPSRKRSGIRAGSRPAFLPVTPAPDPEPDEDARQLAVLTAALISVPCPEVICAAQGGHGCTPAAGAGGVIVLARNPLVITHISRADAAVTAGVVSLDDVQAQFAAGTVPAALAGK